MALQDDLLLGQNKTHLPILPTELTRRIANFLPDALVIASLRLTCRHLHAKTYASFGAAIFETIELDLSTASIEWLQILADNDTFCKCVRAVHICPTRRTPRKPVKEITDVRSGPYPMLGHGVYWMRDPTGCIDHGVPVIKCALQNSIYRVHLIRSV
jgi:hypothetical protein